MAMRLNYWRFLAVAGALVAAALLVCAPGELLAQDEAKPAAKSSPKANADGKAIADGKIKAAGKTKDAAVAAFTPEREAAALAFVREHHAEVADLLDNLRKKRPEQYRRAARELFRASERVQQWQDRDPERYDLELRTWKINSRIQLLLARSTMSPDMDVEAELKSLLAERIEVRLALRRHERKQAAKRLAAIDADIQRLVGNKDEAVERQLAQMRQRVSANRQKIKPAAPKQKPGPADEAAKPAAGKPNR